jgi:hypothetical protein
MTRQKQIGKALGARHLIGATSASTTLRWPSIASRLQYGQHGNPRTPALNKEGRRKLRIYLAALKREQAAYKGLGPLRSWFSPNLDFDRNVAMIGAMLEKPSRLSGGRRQRQKGRLPGGARCTQVVDRKVGRTRNGVWVRLATIFYGEQSIDLFHHVRAFKNGPTLIKI